MKPMGLCASKRSLPDYAHLETIHDTLIAWYHEHARDLPWRRTRDPYRILVSEVMLQQIQVARALPFYEAFLRRFPTINDLADAPIADVIHVWGNLGRYRRITNLHRTARIIVHDLDGKFPHDVETLRDLPGIGPYTAGAIACFAFEQDVAFVDTNIRRVFHRLFIGVDIPDSTASERDLHHLAAAAIPPGLGWVWNQALIEFGALHCTARKPACLACPLQSSCSAFPEIQSISRTRPTSGTARPLDRYEGTNRYYRGRVLAALRDLPKGTTASPSLDLPSLGAHLKPDFTDEELPWIAGVVESLCRDGLAVIQEDRPTYDAGENPPSVDLARRRVTLP